MSGGNDSCETHRQTPGVIHHSGWYFARGLQESVKT